jgi:hypothetical protein
MGATDFSKAGASWATPRTGNAVATTRFQRVAADDARLLETIKPKP